LQDRQTVRLLATKTHESVTEIDTSSLVAGKVATEVQRSCSVFHNVPGPQLANSCPCPTATRWKARRQSVGNSPVAVSLPDSSMKLRRPGTRSSPCLPTPKTSPSRCNWEAPCAGDLSPRTPSGACGPQSTVPARHGRPPVRAPASVQKRSSEHRRRPASARYPPHVPAGEQSDRRALPSSEFRRNA